MDDAVIVNVPSAPAVCVAVTTPAETVAMVVLLDTQVAVSVMSCPPLHEAVKEAEGALGERAPVLGVIVIALVQAIETVSGWVPVMAGLVDEVAVIVAVPVVCAVARPPAVISATPAGVILQVTGVVPVLPSLKVPTANICTVLSMVPTKIFGVAGPTASDDKVGFTKKPRQLTASARPASTASAPAARSFKFEDDIDD